MSRRRTRGGLTSYWASFLLGVVLVVVLYSVSREFQRPLQRSVHVSLRGRVNAVGSVASKAQKAVGDGLFGQAAKPWALPRDHPRPGALPTQKMMQAGLTNPTKGRNRSGPVLGCEQFRSSNYTWPPGMKTVAIVGNGPLTPDSRKAINDMDLVVRFNKLQSYVCGDRFDVWASRHGDAVTTRYWGIGQKLNITGCPLAKLLELAEHIWLMNGGDGPFNHFLESYPEIRDNARYIWLDCRRWVTRYLGQFDSRRPFGAPPSTQDEVSPSSGWLVIMMLKDCAPPGTKFHVYGFNWPGGQWPAHKVEEEQGEIRSLERQGVLIIHQTLCKHKYHCNDTTVLPQQQLHGHELPVTD